MDTPAKFAIDPNDAAENREHGVIFARILDGQGGARRISWEDAHDWRRPEGSEETLWLHLDRRVDSVADWLEDGLGLGEATADVLVSHETRPRAFREGDSLVAILRGINLNPGEDMEDMIALQIWSDGTRVVTLRRRRLETPREVMKTLERGVGPKTAGDLFTELVEHLIAQINISIVATNEEIDLLERDADDGEASDLLDRIGTAAIACG